MDPNDDLDIEPDNGKKFYEKAMNYWSSIPPTIDGMLGGFSHISSTDIGDSSKFLKQFLNDPKWNVGNNRVLDCGAGIGRVTKKLLLNHFHTVDLVEQDPEFVRRAPDYIFNDEVLSNGNFNASNDECNNDLEADDRNNSKFYENGNTETTIHSMMKGNFEKINSVSNKKFLKSNASRVERYICSGLQDFIPEPGRYDVIWIQWVLGHLNDEDLVAFFKRCKKGLKEDGIIIFKENICSEGRIFDFSDSSYTRSRKVFLYLIEQSELSLFKEARQRSFPSDLYEVRMFALR